MKMPLIVMQGLVLGTIACDKPTAPIRDSNDDVIESLTIARCHREVKCDRVGDAKRFHDDAACRRDLDARSHVHVASTTCGAIDTGALAACLDAIARTRCDDADPFEGACGGDALCTRRTNMRTNARLTP